MIHLSSKFLSLPIMFFKWQTACIMFVMNKQPTTDYNPPHHHYQHTAVTPSGTTAITTTLPTPPRINQCHYSHRLELLLVLPSFSWSIALTTHYKPLGSTKSCRPPAVWHLVIYSWSRGDSAGVSRDLAEGRDPYLEGPSTEELQRHPVSGRGSWALRDAGGRDDCSWEVEQFLGRRERHR